MSHEHGSSSLGVGHVSPGVMLPLSYPLHQLGLPLTLPAGSTAPTFTRSITDLQGITSQISILSPKMTILLLKTWAAHLPHPAGRWTELPCNDTQVCSEGGKETPWSLTALRDRGLRRGKAGYTRRGCTPDPTISDSCIYYKLFIDETICSGEGTA